MASNIRWLFVVVVCFLAFKWPILIDPSWMLNCAIFSTIILVTCLIFWMRKPLNLIRRLQKGDEENGRFLINLTRRLRSVGEKMPPAFPNGWFCLAESGMLEPGQVISVNALGNRLAIFRSHSDKKVHVLDAYCPHMGADLSVGGRVVNGDCLQCPFHGWTYNGQSGKCVSIPYAKEVPEFARVKRCISAEKNEHIYVWYHCEEEEPNWQVPDIDQITNGQWTYRGRTEHYVNCHIQDIPENGADVAHLNFLHRPSIFLGSDLNSIDLNAQSGPFGEHKWTAQWQQLASPDQDVGVMRLEHRVYIFGRPIPMTEFKVEARQIGPGIVHLLYDAGVLGKGVYVQHVTPVEPFLQKLIHQIYSERKTPTCVAKFFLWAEAQQVERDIMIWNRKGYIRNQILIKEDSLIQRHRRWYAQFYTDSSPRIDEYRNHKNHKSMDF